MPASGQVEQRGNFNPRPPCGGRLNAFDIFMLCLAISIHVPRVGDDSQNSRVGLHKRISIHVPRVGDDILFSPQSPPIEYFNPRPPCGGRPPPYFSPYNFLVISIHVPRVGDDVCKTWVLMISARFQSTSPVWGTTSYLLFSSS